MPRDRPAALSLAPKSGAQRVERSVKKRFGCNHSGCTKSFTRQEHLRRHQLNHQTAPNWICQPCGANFMRSDLWERHLRVTHGLKKKESGNNKAEEIGQLQQTPSSTSVTPSGRSSSVQIADSDTEQHDLVAHANGLDHSEVSIILSPVNERQPNWPKDVLNTSAWQAPDNTGVTNPLSGSITSFDHDTNNGGGASILDVSYLGNSWNLENTAGFYLSGGNAESHAGFFPQSDFNDNLDWFLEGWADDKMDIPSIVDPPSAPTVAYDMFTPESYHLQHDECSFDGLPEDGVKSPGTPRSREVGPDKSVASIIFHCKYKICNAITDERRSELLTWLAPIVPGLDILSPLLALDNLRFGAHRYARRFGKEFSIFQPTLLVPETEQHRADIIECYGEEIPEVLTWSIVALGWSYLDTGPNAELAIKIYRGLRRFVIEEVASTIFPSLWILQTMIHLAVFGRYQGTSLDYNAAVIFHGILIDMVRRMDLRDVTSNLPNLEQGSGLQREWLKWIRKETMKRIVFHSFILDVQHSLVHGGNANMSPFELNLPCEYNNECWFAETAEDWAVSMVQKNEKPVSFLAKLKQLWNTPTSYYLTQELVPDATQALLYGIVAVASDLRRKDENIFAPKARDSMVSVNEKLSKSFEVWLDRWGRSVSMLRQNGLERSWYRNCSCMFRLAYTLYEISPVDLQTLAGRDVNEGRRMSQRDYQRSKQKVKAWAKHDRAFIATSHAAQLIQERLRPNFSAQSHCSHCRWCLYLSSLICWNYGFACTGKGGTSKDLIENGQLKSMSGARRECEEYLTALAFSRTQASPFLGETTGLLIVVIELLSNSSRTATNDSIKVLKRLIGLDPGVSDASPC